MGQFLVNRTAGLYTVLLMIIHSCSSSEVTVKLEVRLNGKEMILSCLVTNKNEGLKIYLRCPLVPQNGVCAEDCAQSCKNCDSFTCGEQASNSALTQIKYVIDLTKAKNTGKWSCSHSYAESSSIFINASIPKNNPTTFDPQTRPSIATTTNIKTTTRKQKPQVTTKHSNSIQKATRTNSDDSDVYVPYEKLITKSEFIMAVIGLLALSLIFNIFFCCRMTIIHCRTIKTRSDIGNYFPVNANNHLYNRSNSHVSDSERIYEDTSVNHHNIPYLTQIKNGNGTYLASSTLSPNSANSTMLRDMPCNHSIQLSNSPTENGSHNMHPSIMDNSHPTYATVNVPTGNHYTQFVSVQPEMSRRDSGGGHHPVYLSFPTGNPMLLSGNRYVQYDSQPLQSISPISQETRPTSQTPETVSSSLPHHMNPYFSNIQNERKSNYQLSREMMEEADNLLRTADTLLKSTGTDIKLYQQ